MVKGKGDYDLFVSFVGYKLSFLDALESSAPKHIARAYVEFPANVQPMILSKDKKGRDKIFESAGVLYPVDKDSPEKGLKKGGSLREYYIETVRKKLLNV